jgi:hypothetical protein
LVLRGGLPPRRKFLKMRALLAFSKTVAVFAFNVLNATWYKLRPTEADFGVTSYESTNYISIAEGGERSGAVLR